MFTKFVEPLGTRSKLLLLVLWELIDLFLTYNTFITSGSRLKINSSSGSTNKSIKSGWVCAR